MKHSTLIEAGGGGAHHENVDMYKGMNIEKKGGGQGNGQGGLTRG